MLAIVVSKVGRIVALNPGSRHIPVWLWKQGRANELHL